MKNKTTVSQNEQQVIFHTLSIVVFEFQGFLRQKGLGSTDTNVNDVAVILHALHTRTQDLHKRYNNFCKCRFDGCF